ncbi:trace amine-associated receptor 3-like [Bombina bombina]|uniref:trace amine-associated receptor 3-like n=1 Tax=Bombina bombina TaxID=8345 RepID=UPI00235A9B8F|nr:trace amine-associated receptor 3-like [Bombina bombina]
MEVTNPICAQFENSSSRCPANRAFGLRLGLYMLLTCSISISVFGNLCMIISISHFQQLHSPTNFLILSLATTDLFLGLFIMPYSMVRSIEKCWLFGNSFCKIHYAFDLTLSTISIYHLCLIAIDRFYAICDPLHYPTKITIPVIKRLLIFCWSIPVIFSLGVVISNSHISGVKEYEILVTCFSLCPITFNKLWAIIIFFICFFVPGSIMVGIYIKIFLVCRRHIKMLKNITGDTKQISSQISNKKDRKAAKKLGILMSVFLTCWLPIFTTLLIDPFLNFSTPEIMFEIFNWFSYINSTFNPLLYGFLYPWFRKAVKYILLGNICDPHSCTNSLFTDN